MGSPRADAEPSFAQLRVQGLCRSVGDRPIHQGLSFSISSGETLFVVGPSGVGKSLLLRELAYLDPFDSGSITLAGKAPEEWGVPRYRALVSYVHQSRIQHKGTPAELYYTLQQFKAQRGRQRGDLPALIHQLGLEQAVLNQPWVELSGGQAQRVALAVAIALKPLVLLLDEPTSALDADSTRRLGRYTVPVDRVCGAVLALEAPRVRCKPARSRLAKAWGHTRQVASPLKPRRVEAVLKGCGAAVVWVSHDPNQPARVGGRVLNLPLGNESAALTPPSPPPLGASVRASEQLQPEERKKAAGGEPERAGEAAPGTTPEQAKQERPPQQADQGTAARSVAK